MNRTSDYERFEADGRFGLRFKDHGPADDSIGRGAQTVTMAFTSLDAREYYAIILMHRDKLATLESQIDTLVAELRKLHRIGPALRNLWRAVKGQKA